MFMTKSTTMTAGVRGQLRIRTTLSAMMKRTRLSSSSVRLLCPCPIFLTFPSQVLLFATSQTPSRRYKDAQLRRKKYLSRLKKNKQTETQNDDKHRTQAANDYRTAARVADRPFLPIYLVCDAAEHLVRVRTRSAEPAIKYQGKPPEEKAVAALLMTAPLFRF